MIRKLELKDKESWAKLYSGYANFYKAQMNAEILEALWGWILDENHIIKGISINELAFINSHFFVALIILKNLPIK